MTFGEKILQLRKATGLSQEQLAELVGVSRQAISKWETDQSMPEIEKVLLLSKTFSISTDELLGNEAMFATSISSPQLIGIAKNNVKKRHFTLGWVTAVMGGILLIIEMFSLRIIQHNEMRLELEYASGTGYFADPMQYAFIEPMPTIFKVTVAIIAIGIALIAFSLICAKRQLKTK
jgi:transcriptional regulator with XRE-family HTH domain